LALAQIFHLGNARSDDVLVDPRRIFANRFAVAALMLSAILQISPTLFPQLATLLHVVPLGFRDWVVVLAFSSLTALVGQAIRLVGHHPQPSRPA
jgi:Ca2+-transporting ATPase